MQRGLMQPMSAMLLEHTALAKPYFDRDGLIVAVDNDRPIGFVHAGFGASPAGGGLSTEVGVTSLLLVHPAAAVQEVASELFRRSEEYLVGHGAKLLYAGGIGSLNPFYLGFYGGSELPGILRSDPVMQGICRNAGYHEIDTVVVLHRELSGFRPIVDRQQMQIRRRTTLETTVEPPSPTWWDACTMGDFERTQYQLLPKEGGAAIATVSFWRMSQLSTGWGVNAAGLIDLSVQPDQQGQGLATYLISEAFRQLINEGTTLVEAQALASNAAALATYQKLGFTEVDRGSIFRKSAVEVGDPTGRAAVLGNS